MVYEVTKPSNQRMTRMIAIVSSMFGTPLNGLTTAQRPPPTQQEAGAIAKEAVSLCGQPRLPDRDAREPAGNDQFYVT
jgi:hypothetical protein